MNIFVLGDGGCPKLSAMQHCNRHVIKMVLETAQILSSNLPKDKGPYRRTHYNHPVVQWVRNSKENYLWTVELGLYLAEEYTFRYSKTHKSKEVIETCYKLAIEQKLVGFLQEKKTEFVQCMPEEYKVSGNPVLGYRNFYNAEKASFAVWTKREQPSWFVSK
jgi:hypothetical protein